MKLFICILGLTAMALAGDNDDHTGFDDILKQGNDKFTAEMFYEVAKENPGKNVILSPFSVLSPLGQLALASVGESHNELLKAIGMPNSTVTKAVFTNLNRGLRSVTGVTLNTANRIYIAPDAQLNENFALLSRESFNSDVKNIDFSKTESVNEINSWVENQTNHKIRNLLREKSVDASTRAILVNAIYFKGNWQHKFDEKLTVSKDFHVSKDKTVKVDTMSISEDFLYGESAELDAKLLQMPYEGGETSFVIVLPNQVDGIENLEEKLQDPSVLNKAVSQMFSSKVDVALPKFKIETEINLRDILQKMNVTKLFDPSEAKLNHLLHHESNLYISSAIQKAFIEVSEEGAEAAAANAFLIAKAGFIADYVKLEVDHPFYYQIKFGDLILFNGIYSR